MGTRGARGGVVSVGSALGATRVLKQKLLRIAAHLLEAPLEDLELVDGSIRVRGAPTSGMTIAQLAQKAYFAPTELPTGIEPGLDATHAFDPPPLTVSSGTHICQVEIDPETGGLMIPRYTIVEDCGRMLNPRVVEGQLHGATAQGIGGALLEEIVYDADGQNRCATLLDYAIPTAALMPSFEVEHLERFDPNTPLGMKGMAGGGGMGASAAVSNDVADARAPVGSVRRTGGRSERGSLARGGGDLHRPHQSARVRLARLDRQPAVRRVAQSLGSHPHAWRVHRRRSGSRCRRVGAAGARLGRRRLDPHPRQLLRARRSQADFWARAHVPRGGRQRIGRPRLPARANRARRRPHDERDRPSRSARSVRAPRRRCGLPGRLR